MLRWLFNVIWLVTGGIWLALGYFLFGLIACIFIVTIPAGIASFRMAQYALWPFGKAVVPAPGAHGGHALMNAIWFCVAGLWLAIAHVTTAVAQFATIIGIPLALVNLKMIPVTCFPFGKRVIDARLLPPGERPLHSI